MDTTDFTNQIEIENEQKNLMSLLEQMKKTMVTTMPHLQNKTIFKKIQIL
jgi:hypothetical protein